MFEEMFFILTQGQACIAAHTRAAMAQSACCVLHHQRRLLALQVPREFPYDNLAEELGGDNGLESCVKHH